MDWVKLIKEWIPVGAGVLTFIGLLLIWIQLKQNDRHSKITRSNQLIDNYYTFYVPMLDESKISETVDNYQFGPPDTSFLASTHVMLAPDPSGELKGKLEQSYKRGRYISFYVILGVYWYHDLIDKDLVKKLIPIENDYSEFQKDREELIVKVNAQNLFFYWDNMINEICNPKPRIPQWITDIIYLNYLV